MTGHDTVAVIDPNVRGRRRRPGRPPKGEAIEEGARDALVASALELFARKGYEGTTLAQVAKDAGATASLVHYYFESKDQLWKTALSAVLAELTDEFRLLESELADVDTLTALETVIRRFIAFSSRHPEVSLILRNERGESGPRIEWLWREHWAPLRALPRGLIVAGQGSGLLRPGNPDHLLQIIIGACLHPLRGRLSLQQMYGVEPESQAVFALHADLVVETLLDGLRRQA